MGSARTRFRNERILFQAMLCFSCAFFSVPFLDIFHFGIFIVFFVKISFESDYSLLSQFSEEEVSASECFRTHRIYCVIPYTSFKINRIIGYVLRGTMVENIYQKNKPKRCYVCIEVVEKRRPNHTTTIRELIVKS